MDYKDFNIVGNMPTDLYDLKVGDFFMEDTYPEVFVVRLDFLEIQKDI